MDLKVEENDKFVREAIQELVDKQILGVVVKSRAKIPGVFHKTVASLYFTTYMVEKMGTSDFDEALEQFVPVFDSDILYFYKPTFRN